MEKIVVRAIITNKEGKVLLGKRANGVAVGLYSLIGGKPDKNEAYADAIIREVKEEIGLDFSPIPYSEKFDSSFDSANPWKVYYFTGAVQGNLNLDTNEIADVIYISEAELDKVNIAFDCKERLFEYFQSSNP